MTLWFLLTTPLMFVQVFVSLPTQYPEPRGWRGRRVEKFDPPVVMALQWDRGWLIPDVPKPIRLVLGGASRWHFVRWGADYLTVTRDLQPQITYCWRGSRLLDLDQYPLGEPLALVDEGL